MKKLKTIFLILLGLSFNQILFGQVKENNQAQIYQGDANKAQSGLGGIGDNGMIRQPRRTEENYEFFKGYRNEARKENAERENEAIARVEEISKRFTAPSEYLDKYSEYTGKKDSGIFRLFPDIKCGQGNTVDVTELERCGDLPQVTGFGSRMFFRLKKFPMSRASQIEFFFGLSDLHFIDNTLESKSVAIANHPKSKNIAIENLIAEIGTGDLKDIKSDSEGVKFLVEWKKSRKKSQFASHKLIIEKGIENNGYKYSSSVAVKMNTIYALRSIAYYEEYQDFYNTDLLIAFKIVGREKDGSVIIIWKQLRKNDDTYIT